MGRVSLAGSGSENSCSSTTMQVVFSSSMALIIMYGNFLLWVVGVRTGVGVVFGVFQGTLSQKFSLCLHAADAI